MIVIYITKTNIKVKNFNKAQDLMHLLICFKPDPPKTIARLLLM